MIESPILKVEEIARVLATTIEVNMSISEDKLNELSVDFPFLYKFYWNSDASPSYVVATTLTEALIYLDKVADPRNVKSVSITGVDGLVGLTINYSGNIGDDEVDMDVNTECTELISE